MLQWPSSSRFPVFRHVQFVVVCFFESDLPHHFILEQSALLQPIHLGDNSVVYSAGVGKVWFEPLLSGHPAPPVCLSRVVHVPRLFKVQSSLHHVGSLAS